MFWTESWNGSDLWPPCVVPYRRISCWKKLQFMPWLALSVQSSPVVMYAMAFVLCRSASTSYDSHTFLCETPTCCVMDQCNSLIWRDQAGRTQRFHCCELVIQKVESFKLISHFFTYSFITYKLKSRLRPPPPLSNGALQHTDACACAAVRLVPLRISKSTGGIWK